MNSSQPSAGGGGMMTMIIVIVLLIAIGVGGYFGYTKWWVPRQCNNKGPDTTSNVSTFVWDSDSGMCVANVCSDGYGTKATGGAPPCVTYVATPQYTLFSNTVSTSFDGKCGGSTPSAAVTTAKVRMDCETACNGATGCVGYDWDDSNGCNTYSKPLLTPMIKDTNYKCYQPPS